VDDLGVRIEQGESGAPVSVARLTDRARVDHVTGGRFQLQRHRLRLPHSAVFGTKAIGAGTIGEESALKVGVAEESDRGIDGDERDQGIADRNHVGIFIVGRAVNQLDVREILEGKRPLRESVQPVVVFGSELIASPDGGRCCHGIEVIQCKESGGSFVVISADKNLPQRAGAINNFVGRSAVADDVAEVGHKIEGRSASHASLHGFQVGVNVAKQQYAQ